MFEVPGGDQTPNLFSDIAAIFESCVRIMLDDKFASAAISKKEKERGACHSYVARQMHLFSGGISFTPKHQDFGDLTTA